MALIGLGGGAPFTGHHVIHHYHHSTHTKHSDLPEATPAPPPAPSPPPPPAADPFKSMDVEYRKPKALHFQVPTIFKLVIASHSVAEAHETLAPLHGQLVDTQVKLGNNVTAVLWGDPKTVDIASGDPPGQDVSASANRVWTWSVTPKTMRPIHLQLTIHAGDPSHGDDRLQYAETFKVQVHAADEVKNWIDDYDPIWKWLVAFVTTVVGAAAAVWRFLCKKRDPQPG